MNTDPVGTLLRDFYLKFGMPEEGPPLGVNVSGLTGRDELEEPERSIIQNAIRDASLFRWFSDCRTLVEGLATQLTGDDLLKELSGVRATREEFEQLSSGVLWFSLASSIDMRQGGIPRTPFDDIQQLPLPLKTRMSVQGSLVMRLFIALVYMREGPLNQIIRESAKRRRACSSKVKKLMHTDYVRHIRNSLSHGTFSTCAVGVIFRDETKVLVATPGFLGWLCTWIMLIQLQVLTAVSYGLQDESSF